MRNNLSWRMPTDVKITLPVNIRNLTLQEIKSGVEKKVSGCTDTNALNFYSQTACSECPGGECLPILPKFCDGELDDCGQPYNYVEHFPELCRDGLQFGEELHPDFGCIGTAEYMYQCPNQTAASACEHPIESAASDTEEQVLEGDIVLNTSKTGILKGGISKRVFGSDIPEPVKNKLFIRQELSKNSNILGSQDTIKSPYSKEPISLKNYQTNYSGLMELSNRTPFARIWTALEQVRAEKLTREVKFTELNPNHNDYNDHGTNDGDGNGNDDDDDVLARSQLEPGSM